MGQRLNVEIVFNGETKANSYYHWSGYTSSALEITNAILESLDDIMSNIEQDYDVVKAIRLLELTGAGLTDNEKECVLKTLEVTDKNFKECMGRNEGLIAVSEKGIEETRRWEDARVTIDMTNECVVFSALCILDSEEYNDIYSDEDDEDIKELEKVAFSYDTSCIPFKDFLDFKNDLDELHDRGIYSFIMNDEIYMMIA